MTTEQTPASADAAVHQETPEIVIAPTPQSGLSTAADQAERAATALPALGLALAGPLAEFQRSVMQSQAESIRPDEIEVKLGLSFEGGVRWAIVGTAGAKVDVSFKWKSPKAADPLK